MLTPVRRRLAAVAVVLLVPALGACGLNYQTNEFYQPGIGVNDRDGEVDVLAAVVVSSTEGSGTFVASLVNQNLEESVSLVRVSGEEVEAELLGSAIEIGPEELVNLADMGVIAVDGERVRRGLFVRVTLEFDNGQKTRLNVPVVGKDAEYSDVKPALPGTTPTS